MLDKRFYGSICVCVCFGICWLAKGMTSFHQDVFANTYDDWIIFKRSAPNPTFIGTLQAQWICHLTKLVFADIKWIAIIVLRAALSCHNEFSLAPPHFESDWSFVYRSHSSFFVLDFHSYSFSIVLILNFCLLLSFRMREVCFPLSVCVERIRVKST